jgi:hypothetical protein
VGNGQNRFSSRRGIVGGKSFRPPWPYRSWGVLPDGVETNSPARRCRWWFHQTANRGHQGLDGRVVTAYFPFQLGNFPGQFLVGGEQFAQFGKSPYHINTYFDRSGVFNTLAAMIARAR